MRKKRAKELKRVAIDVAREGFVRPDQLARFYKQLKAAWNRHQLVKKGK